MFCGIIGWMWEIYDALIDGMAREPRVDDSFMGEYLTMVRSGNSVGLAMTLHDSTRPAMLDLPSDDPACGGIALRELAAAAKSWNLAEASLGMAAINAYWNSPERPLAAEALERGDTEAFSAWKSRVAGKKVAVIGHFFNLEQTLGGVCDLSILEKRPGPGDYPDSAAEFLLPESDFVFATGVTFTNKTLPRLLELSRAATFILAGPSVPLAPPLFDWGIRDIHSLVITEPELCSAILRETPGSFQNGERPSARLLRAGKRVNIQTAGAVWRV
ncbi:MAG: DUF364 domain-containing protein [Spirochaetaceae bacterium]|nr:DUF364 domain-containing protein [Spirochaetaceae bacterium]